MISESFFAVSKRKSGLRDHSSSDSNVMDKSEKYTETKSINGTTGSSVGKLDIFFDGKDPEEQVGKDQKLQKENNEEEEEKNNADLKKRKFSKSKLPKEATDILQGWFLLNISSPYPEFIELTKFPIIHEFFKKAMRPRTIS